MFSGAFWKSAAERALKTFAQALVAVWGGGEWLDIVHVDFAHSASVALGAAVLSLLTSVVSAPMGGDDVKGDPSLV